MGIRHDGEGERRRRHRWKNRGINQVDILPSLEASQPISRQSRANRTVRK